MSSHLQVCQSDQSFVFLQKPQKQPVIYSASLIVLHSELSFFYTSCQPQLERPVSLPHPQPSGEEMDSYLSQVYLHESECNNLNQNSNSADFLFQASKHYATSMSQIESLLRNVIFFLYYRLNYYLLNLHVDYHPHLCLTIVCM